jgi:two-component sensor histidine kinase
MTRVRGRKPLMSVDVQPRGSDPLLTLMETVEDLSAARTIDQVAAVVRSAARRISGADGVAFVLRDGETCWYLDEDAIGPLWKGRRFPMSACVSGWAMLNRQTVVVQDIYRDDRVPHDAYRPTFVKSLVVTPVRPKDPIAAIGAYWSTERRPTEEEVRRLEVMSRATATALENAKMYASLTETLERRKFLLRELDHRCKNTLASVQSIADQTLRAARSPDDFVEAFNGRLVALSHAHDLLTRGSWGPAELHSVIAAALSPFGGATLDRVTIDGPNIRLAPETSVAMHMAFHELAVNAARHGALGAEDGRVEISWRIEAAGEPRTLALVWRESGGPPPPAEPRLGFGARLLERALARELGGEGRLLFEREGLRFVLTAPLSARLDQA